MAISRASQAVIDRSYFWTLPLSSSEHTPTQLSFSKLCQDGQDPTDVVHAQTAGSTDISMTMLKQEDRELVHVLKSNTDAESKMIMGSEDMKICMTKTFHK